MFMPIKVLDIHLDRPLETVRGLDVYRAVRGLVRFHNIPMGYIDVPVTGDFCSATSLRQAAWDLYRNEILAHLVEDGLAVLPDTLRLDRLVNLPHPVFAGPFPKVTVAVCTRDRSEDLAVCLEAIKELDYPNMEILIVDNASRDNASERLVREQYPNIRYFYEPRPGLDWARNRAVAEASGEIIAFTDDDVRVDPLWIRSLAQVFAENPDVMAVTGLVVPLELETRAQELFENYGGFGRGFTRQWYFVNKQTGEAPIRQHGWAGKFGTGANMSFRKTLFNKIGGFDTALDVGTVTNGGGDIEMFFRIMQEGYMLVYEPAAIVRHRHRRNYPNLRKQIANNGVGFSAYLVRCALAYPQERLAIFRFWFAWLCWWPLPRLWRSFIGKETFPRDLIVSELWGYFAGLGSYPRARRRAKKILQENGPMISIIQPFDLSIQ